MKIGLVVMLLYYLQGILFLRMMGVITTSFIRQNIKLTVLSLGKLVTEKPVDFVGFDNVVEFNKNRQNDDNVVKAYKGLFS